MVQDQGSLEKAVNGDYQIDVGEVLSEAWERVSGSKLQLVGGMVVYVVITLLVTGLFSFFLNDDSVLTEIIVGFLASPVTVPLMVGMLLLGYSRANDEEVKLDSMFNYYTLVWPLVFASLLVTILTYIGLALLLLPGIYLATAYTFTLPLMVDKKLGIWAAMEVSRQAVTKKWFSVFGVSISLFLIMMVSAIPFGIGLIWTIPLALIAHGVMYRKIFGWKIHDPLNTEIEQSSHSTDDTDRSV